MAWTDEMVDKLRQMWTEGKTATEIAKELGVTKDEEPVEKAEVEKEIPEEAEENVEVIAETVEPVKTEKVEKKHKSSCHVKLVELDSHTCRWPLGDPRDEDFCFCGKKVRMGQTYCEEHANMAYVKATKK